MARAVEELVDCAHALIARGAPDILCHTRRLMPRLLNLPIKLEGLIAREEPRVARAGAGCGPNAAREGLHPRPAIRAKPQDI